MIEGEIIIGDFLLCPSYSRKGDKIGIIRKGDDYQAGEGGDFDARAFEEMIRQFYEENF